MSVIYQPNGAALEYAQLAVNLYRGCRHGCTYCYAPRCLHMKLDEFSDAKPRADILKKLEIDAKKMAGDPRPVLLCFTCDPYGPDEEKDKITQQAIEILGQNRMQMRVLTKNGALANRDFHLMGKYNVEFGETIIFSDDATRQKYEPHAGTIEERIEAMRTAHTLGLRTWVSVEPVIDPDQALKVIDTLRNSVDVWKIGKLNHDAELERTVDWRKFVDQVMERMGHYGCRYYIKNELWKYASPQAREMKQFTIASHSYCYGCRAEVVAEGTTCPKCGRPIWELQARTPGKDSQKLRTTNETYRRLSQGEETERENNQRG